MSLRRLRCWCLLPPPSRTARCTWRIDEIESWVAEKLHELLHLLEKAAPVVEKVAAAAARLAQLLRLWVAAVEKVAEGVVTCCGHVHFGTCAENCPVCSKAAAK